MDPPDLESILAPVLDALPDAVLILDGSRRILLANRLAHALFGTDESALEGRPLRDVLPAGGDFERLESDLDHPIGSRRQLSWPLAGASARTLILEQKALSSGQLMVLLRDVTEVQALEKRLLEAERMQSFGQIAGSIVHDLNNVLVPILCLASAGRNEDQRSDESAAVHQNLRTAAERASALARRLLDIARDSLPALPAVVALNATIGELRALIDPLVGSGVEVITRLDPALALVRVDREQLERLLLNLTTNARDAMPHGGSLIIETSNVTLGESPKRGPFSASAGPYVMLSFSDTGVGMDEATKQRIFEPFFTTKESGKGTGLGLSTALPFLHRSHGWISVESEPGMGTCFRLYLPAANEPAN